MHLHGRYAKQACKIALAALLCQAIALAFHLQAGFLAVITSLVLISLFHHELIEKGIERFIGPCLAAIIAVLLMLFLPQQLWLYALVLVLGVFMFAYLYVSQFLHYAMLMGGITFAFLLCDAYATSQQAAISLAFDWVICIAIGFIVAAVIEALIFPEPFRNTIKPTLIKLIADINTLYQHPAHHHQLLSDKINPLLKQINNSELKFFSAALSQAKLQALTTHLRELIVIAAALNTEQKLLTPCFEELIHQLEQHQPKEAPFTQLEQTLQQQAAHLKQLRQNKQQWQENLFERLEDVTQLTLLQQAKQHLQHISLILTELKQPSIKVSLEKISVKIKLTLRHAITPIHLDKLKAIKAVKIALPPVIIFVINQAFSLEQFTIQALITATVITAQIDLGKATARIHQRIIGISMGGLLGVGMMAILQIWPSHLLLLLMIFVSFFVLGYYTLKSKKYGYNFLQALIMIPLILLVDLNHFGSTTIALQRFAGAWEGVLIGILVLYLIKPIYPYQIALTHAKRALSKLSESYQACDINAITDSISQARGALSSLSIITLGDKSKKMHLPQLLQQIEIIAIHTRLLTQNLIQGANDPLWQQWYPQAKPIIHQTSDVLARLSHDLNSKVIAIIKQQQADLETLAQTFHQQGITANYELTSLGHYCVVVCTLRNLLRELESLAQCQNSL